MSLFKKGKIFNITNLTVLLTGLFVALTALLFIYYHTLCYRSEELIPYDRLPPFGGGDSYTQELTCTRNGFRELELYCATYSREDAGTVTASLIDSSGELIQTWNIDAAVLPDNDFIHLTLDQLIDNSEGKTYYLSLVADSPEGSDALFYTTTDRNAVGLSYLGEDMQQTLCYRLVYNLPTTYLFNPTTILTTVLFLILIPILFRIAVVFFPIKRIWLLAIPQIAAIIGCHRLLKDSSFYWFNPNSVAGIYASLCIIWTIGCIVFYRLIFAHKTNVEKLAVICLSLFTLISIGFLTPGSCHDEQHHYCYAYKFANIFSFKGLTDPVDSDGNSIVYMRDEDAALLTQMQMFINEREYHKAVSGFHIFSNDNSLHEYKYSDIGYHFSYSGLNVPFGYIASGMGITIGRALHLGALPTFYLGRIFNALMFIIFVYFSIKIIPVGKETLFVISMFPMVWQQVASFSYDAFLIGIVFLFIAVTVRLFKTTNKITIMQIIAVVLLAFLVAISKFVYAPLVLILLALPAARFNVKNPTRFKKICVASLIVIGVAAFVILQHKLSIIDYFIPSFIYEGQSGFLNLVRFVEIMFMTLIELIDYYVQGIVAYVGWYQIPIPVVMLMVYYVLLLFTMFRRNNEINDIPYTTKLWGALLVFITCILVALPMAAKFTDPSDELIDGIQGRYFLPVLPIVCIGLRTKLITVDESVYKKVVYGSTYIGFMFFAFLFLKTFAAI